MPCIKTALVWGFAPSPENTRPMPPAWCPSLCAFAQAHGESLRHRAENPYVWLSTLRFTYALLKYTFRSYA